MNSRLFQISLLSDPGYPALCWSLWCVGSWVSVGWYTFFLHTATQFDQDHLLKLQSLFQCVFLVYFCVSTWHWKSSFQLLWRIMLEFGWWFHWICSLFFIEWLFLTTLIWLIHNHGRSIIWYLIQFLSSVSLSSSYTSFFLVGESYFKIFWGYCERYCFPDVVLNQIAIVCREATDFCVLILCPDTCMEVFILYLWQEFSGGIFMFIYVYKHIIYK